MISSGAKVFVSLNIRLRLPVWLSYLNIFLKKILLQLILILTSINKSVSQKLNDSWTLFSGDDFRMKRKFSDFKLQYNFRLTRSTSPAHCQAAKQQQITSLKGICHTICDIFKKAKTFFALIEFQKEWSSFAVSDYIQALKLFPFVCCHVWQGWTWIET